MSGYSVIGGGAGGGGAPDAVVEVGPAYGGASSTASVAAAARAALGELGMQSRLASGAGVAALVLPVVHAPLAQGAALGAPQLETLMRVGVGAGIADARAFIQDVEPDDDTWLNEASAATNYGAAATLECKGDTAVLSDTKRAYLAWDLTGLGGATVAGATLRLRMAHNGIGSKDNRYEIYTHPSQPFDEATATWSDDEAPPGTLRQSGTVSGIPAGGTAVSITLDAATRAAMLGNWLYVRLLGATLDTTATFTTPSKEAASNTPELDMTLDLA